MDLLTKYIIATTNFYGVVSTEIITNLYNQQNEIPITEADVFEYVVQPPPELAQHFVYEEGGLFVQDSLFIGDDTLLNLIEEKNGKPYYLPTKEELLPYLDPNYIEKNDYYDQLRTYLTDRLSDFKEELIEEICENFVFALKDQELNFGFIVQQLQQSGVSLEEETDFDTLVHLVSELGLNIRLWQNNGFTQKELFETKIASLLHPEAYRLNTNPDYPCPCQSGESYNDCCKEAGQKVKRLDDYRT